MYVVKQLAAQLRPELESLIKSHDDAPGTPYAFRADACARRAIKNKALSMLTRYHQIFVDVVDITDMEAEHEG